jgi:hypothetical protein
MKGRHMTEAAKYEPRQGDKVTVRRYIQPTAGERTLDVELSGVITDPPQYVADGYYLWLDSVPDMIFTGYQFLGVGEDGHSPANLVTEVELTEPARPELYRQQVTPDMSVIADGAAVVLEVTDGLAGHVVRRVTLANHAEFFNAIEASRIANIEYQADADRRRTEGLTEARRARGHLLRSEAVDWLMARGRSRNEAAGITCLLEDGISPEFSYGQERMTYADSYWRVPAGTAA